jgi:hypothetical protein
MYKKKLTKRNEDVIALKQRDVWELYNNYVSVSGDNGIKKKKNFYTRIENEFNKFITKANKSNIIYYKIDLRELNNNMNITEVYENYIINEYQEEDDEDIDDEDSSEIFF